MMVARDDHKAVRDIHSPRYMVLYITGYSYMYSQLIRSAKNGKNKFTIGHIYIEGSYVCSPTNITHSPCNE